MLDPKHGKVRSRSDCGADHFVDVLDARPIRVGLLRQPVQRVIHLLAGLILAVGLAGQVVLGVAAVLSDVVARPVTAVRRSASWYVQVLVLML